MDNKEFIFQMQNQYESLKHFSIKDNNLILNKDGIYSIPLNSVVFANLNPNLFLLDAKEIFHIIRMLELLPKKELNYNEMAFINQYVNRYIKLNDMALTESNIDNNLIIGLNIPIYLSYDTEYEFNPCSIMIQKILVKHSEEIEKMEGNSKDSQKRLVLTPNNPNFIQIYEEDKIHNFEKAGFVSLLLITSTIAATCVYIAYFILGR